MVFDGPCFVHFLPYHPFGVKISSVCYVWYLKFQYLSLNYVCSVSQLHYLLWYYCTKAHVLSMRLEVEITSSFWNKTWRNIPINNLVTPGKTYASFLAPPKTFKAASESVTVIASQSIQMHHDTRIKTLEVIVSRQSEQIERLMRMIEGCLPFLLRGGPSAVAGSPVLAPAATH